MNLPSSFLETKGPYDALCFYRSNSSDTVFDSTVFPLKGFYGLTATWVLVSHRDQPFLSEMEVTRVKQEAQSNLNSAIKSCPDCHQFVEAAAWIANDVDDDQPFDESRVAQLVTMLADSAPQNPSTWRFCMNNVPLNDPYYVSVIGNLIDCDPVAVDALAIAVGVAVSSNDTSAVVNVLDRVSEAISFTLDLYGSQDSSLIWELMLKLLKTLVSMEVSLEEFRVNNRWWVNHFFRSLNYERRLFNTDTPTVLKFRYFVFQLLFPNLKTQLKRFGTFVDEFVPLEESLESSSELSEEVSTEVGSSTDEEGYSS
ncbi:hypothetical protein GEMRC1_002560 [Eukaryota sp. GEM-RC1]